MKTKTYGTLESALLSILKKDKEYRIVTHEFPEGRKVQKHYHPNANEWVIANNGSFKFFYAGRWFDIKLDNDRYTVIHIPAKITHGLATQSKVLYFVARDNEAKTVYT